MMGRPHVSQPRSGARLLPTPIGLAWAALSRRRRFSGGVSGRTSSRTSEGSGVERLLLYLNRDTWIGQDGDTLAEVVRDARYAAGHTSWHGSSDRAQLRH